MRPLAWSPSAWRTRSLTILRPVVVVMGLIFFPAPLSWRAYRGREGRGRPRRTIPLPIFHAARPTPIGRARPYNLTGLVLSSQRLFLLAVLSQNCSLPYLVISATTGKKPSTKLAGLYADNPKRTTATPWAETLLESFIPIYLTAAAIGKLIHLQLRRFKTLSRES